jgi:hypothetical protein
VEFRQACVARSRVDSALFSFKAGDDPMLALDRNLLSVVVRCVAARGI